VVTDLIQIGQLAEKDERENLRFRRFLRQHHYRDDLLHRIAREVEREIDCTACANCCRETRVSVTSKDIDSIARYLNLSREQVIREYTEPDPGDRETILRHNDNGCVFLDGNLCMVYEVRPSACLAFPYLASDARSLGGRMSSVCNHARICPIIYNTIEAYKHAVGYHPCSHHAGSQHAGSKQG
jgi:Fe-S-cluster containining protein